MTTIREILEAAEALRALGLTVFADVTARTLIVFRDDVMIGQLRFPVEDDED